MSVAKSYCTCTEPYLDAQVLGTPIRCERCKGLVEQPTFQPKQGEAQKICAHLLVYNHPSVECKLPEGHAGEHQYGLIAALASRPQEQASHSLTLQNVIDALDAAAPEWRDIPTERLRDELNKRVQASQPPEAQDAQKDNEMLKEKELTVVEHMRHAAVDGCQCEPCIEWRAAFQAGQQAMAEKAGLAVQEHWYDPDVTAVGMAQHIRSLAGAATTTSTQPSLEEIDSHLSHTNCATCDKIRALAAVAPPREEVGALPGKWRNQVRECCPILLERKFLPARTHGDTHQSCSQKLRDADELEAALAATPTQPRQCSKCGAYEESGSVNKGQCVNCGAWLAATPTLRVQP